MSKDNRNVLNPSCGRCWHIHEKSENICNCECHGVKLKPIDPFPLIPNRTEPTKWDDRTRWGDPPYKKPRYYCLMDSFLENNPRERVAFLSCPCPKCSPWC